MVWRFGLNYYYYCYYYSIHISPSIPGLNHLKFTKPIDNHQTNELCICGANFYRVSHCTKQQMSRGFGRFPDFQCTPMILWGCLPWKFTDLSRYHWFLWQKTDSNQCMKFLSYDWQLNYWQLRVLGWKRFQDRKSNSRCSTRNCSKFRTRFLWSFSPRMPLPMKASEMRSPTGVLVATKCTSQRCPVKFLVMLPRLGEWWGGGMAVRVASQNEKIGNQ